MFDSPVADFFRRFGKYILLVFLVLGLASFFLKGRLPDPSHIARELYQDPIQQDTDKAAFSTMKDGVAYLIEPLYRYELWGMVVSYHNSSSWLDYAHKSWSDFLNVRDLCVIWGGNVATDGYLDFDYKSGDWTCFYRTDSNAAWQAFSEDRLSNNHLLADDREINKAIMSAHVGDQIHFKGYLSRYSHAGGFRRGSSTTRTDRGNGACETVYVESFEVLKRANAFWHGLYRVSKYGFFLTLALCLLLFFKGFSRKSLYPEEHHQRGAMLAARGKYKRALQELDKALMMDPDLYEALQDRAYVLESMGRFDLAERDRSKIRELDRYRKLRNPSLGDPFED